MYICIWSKYCLPNWTYLFVFWLFLEKVFPKVLSGNNDDINDTIDAIEGSETQFRVNVSECVNPEPEIAWLLKVILLKCALFIISNRRTPLMASQKSITIIPNFLHANTCNIIFVLQRVRPVTQLSKHQQPYTFTIIQN